MMKRLLVVAAGVLVSALSLAQGWQKPELTFETLKVSEVGGDTTIYYLYNVGADAFFTQGNAYGTQASLGTPALKVIFEKYVEAGAAWDGKTYLITDSCRSKSSWMQLFIDNETNMYVDHNQQADYMWQIEDRGNGVYRFFGADVNPLYNQLNYYGSYMGYDYMVGDEAPFTGPIRPLLEVDNAEIDHEYWVDWKLVGYDAYHAYAPLRATYDAAMALKATMDKIAGEYPEVNLDGADKVYANTASTQAELDSTRSVLNAVYGLAEYVLEVQTMYPAVDVTKAQALLRSGNPTTAMVDEMMAALRHDVRDEEVAEYTKGATEDDPNDITPLMQNPDFEEGNTNGWNITFASGTNATNIGYQGASYNNNGVSINKFIEVWSNARYNSNYPDYRTFGDGSMSQTITQLPAGVYSFECDAIAVTQDQSSVPCKGVYLFATGGDVDMQKPVHTGNNAPEHFSLKFASSGGDIVLGMRTENSNANWMAADNFRLMYYGPLTDDPYKILLEGLIANYEDELGNVEDVKCNAELRQAYLDEIEKARSLTEGFKEEMAVVDSIALLLSQSIGDYAKFPDKLDALYQKQLAFEDSDFPQLAQELGDLYMEWNEKYEEETLTKEYIDNADQQMAQLIIDFITKNVEPGSDITALIVNPDFNNDFSGWSTTGSRPAFGGKGANGQNIVGDTPTLDSGNAEVYHASFNMYQLIRNMPKGSFTITCQAFERNDNNNNRAYIDDWAQGPRAGISAVLYANEFETKVNNIMAFGNPEPQYQALTTNDAGETVNHWSCDRYIEEDYNFYIPNSMEGANFFFNISPETYIVKTEITLENDGDSILIGLKCPATNSWVIFDNFHLIYNGSGKDSYIPAMDGLITSLTDASADEIILGQDARTAALDAIKALEDAKTGTIDDCTTAISKGNEALAYARESESLYSKLTSAYESLFETMILHEDDENVSTEALNQASALCSQAESALRDFNLSNDEVKTLIDEMEQAGYALLLPAGEYIAISDDIFYRWTAADATGEKVEQVTPENNIGTPIVQSVWGDTNVNYLTYADLSDASTLIINVSSGNPRVLLNRTVDGGQVANGQLFETNGNASDYQTVIDNGDGTKTFIINLAKIREEWGFVHLHAIKGANWANVVVTSILIGYRDGLPVAIDTIAKAQPQTAVAGIYSITGAKQQGLQRGINIVRTADGKSAKVLIK